MKANIYAWCLLAAAAVSPLGAGAASANPDMSQLVNTTCSYSQVNAALEAQAPDLANELAKYPMAQKRLQQFLAAPVSQRQQMIQQATSAHPQWQDKAVTPEGQQYAAVVAQVAANCNSY